MAECPNHPLFNLFHDVKEPNHQADNEDCFMCWTNFIEEYYGDDDTPVKGRHMVKLLQLFNKEMTLKESDSVARDTGFRDPDYER